VARGDGPSLAALQRRFFELITAPEGVGAGLRALGVPRAELEVVVEGDRRASAVERLDVYADMYFYRILDVLRGDYPKLVAATGDDAFHDLVTDYLLAHPSRHPSVRNLGAALPQYLEGHDLGGRRPWLPELAALEWARVDVFDRADAAPLSREALAGVDGDAFADLAMPMVPAHEIVKTRHAVEEIWRAIEDGAAPADLPDPVPAPPGHAVLVWRKGVTVFHRGIDRREAEALALARSGASFGVLCSRLGDEMDPEAAAQTAAALLGGWIADELVAGC
jgi:hypothetical protein